MSAPSFTAIAVSLGAIHMYPMQEFGVPLDPNDTVLSDYGTEAQSLESGGTIASDYRVDGPKECIYGIHFDDSPSRRRFESTLTGEEPSARLANALQRQDFTVCVWVKAYASDGAFRGMVLNQVNASPTYHWSLYMGGTVGSPRFGIRIFNSSGGVSTWMDSQSSATISLNTWYFICGRFTSASPLLEYFQNGVLNTSSTSTTGTKRTATAQNWSIGTIINGPPNVDMCLNAAFDYKLTDANILALYNAGLTCIPPPLRHRQRDDGPRKFPRHSGQTSSRRRQNVYW